MPIFHKKREGRGRNGNVKTLPSTQDRHPFAYLNHVVDREDMVGPWGVDEGVQELTVQGIEFQVVQVPWCAPVATKDMPAGGGRKGGREGGREGGRGCHQTLSPQDFPCMLVELQATSYKYCPPDSDSRRHASSLNRKSPLCLHMYTPPSPFAPQQPFPHHHLSRTKHAPPSGIISVRVRCHCRERMAVGEPRNGAKMLSPSIQVFGIVAFS
jgi:hypothetical protein